ncbi:hypothetical protein B0H14DRAFT_3468938 [Mycena olivaceomarginata]|nr:hypothetical protein B0H14DRAFT_3468938 [Mycena olivaceomarginata]
MAPALPPGFVSCSRHLYLNIFVDYASCAFDTRRNAYAPNHGLDLFRSLLPEARNAQTRERMAHLRAQDSVVSPEELQRRLEARREAARKNRRKLALKARKKRAEALMEHQRLHYAPSQQE